MFSKRNSKTKVTVAIIICITMLSMVFLTSCQTADDPDDNNRLKPEETSTMRTTSGPDILEQVMIERSFSMRTADDDEDDEAGNIGSITLGGAIINEEEVKSFNVGEGWWEYVITSDSDNAWLFYTQSAEGVDPVIILIDSDGNDLSVNDDWAGFDAMMLAVFDREETYTLLIGFWDENGQPSMESSTTLTITNVSNVLSNDNLTREITGGIFIFFMPDQTGTWEFLTTESGESDPNITLFSRYSEILGEADDNAGGNDANLTIQLTEGTPYIIFVDFWDGPETTTTLQVTFLG